MGEEKEREGGTQGEWTFHTKVLQSVCVFSFHTHHTWAAVARLNQALRNVTVAKDTLLSTTQGSEYDCFGPEEKTLFPCPENWDVQRRKIEV